MCNPFVQFAESRTLDRNLRLFWFFNFLTALLFGLWLKNVTIVIFDLIFLCSLSQAAHLALCPKLYFSFRSSGHFAEQSSPIAAPQVGHGIERRLKRFGLGLDMVI